MGYLTDFYDAIVTQLTFHTTHTESTAILPDVYFYKSPIEETRGNDRYPQVRMWFPSTEEAMSGVNVSCTLNVGLVLAVRNDQNSQQAMRDLLDLYERTGDALFVKTDGTTMVNRCLGPVIAESVRYSLSEMEVTETSINAVAYVSTAVKARQGNRRKVVV